MHAYSTILLAALTLGEAEGRTGMRFLAAATAAAGVQSRVAIAHPLQDVWHLQDVRHSSAVRRYIGAAVADGKMLGLDAEGMRHTLGLAFPQAHQSVPFPKST
jgi:2-methylcitrate dehydratase PrpD